MKDKDNLEKRHEVVFLYDVRDANPNGDPLDEDKPRIDDETGENFVTDVRLKRTIRDQLLEMGENIFIREKKRNDGTQMSRARRIAEFVTKKQEEDNKSFEDWDNSKEEIEEMETSDETSDLREELKKLTPSELERALLNTYIDLRVFGATVATENSTITKTGPLQFNFGRSLHEVKPMLVKGTTVMPSQEGKGQGTMTEVWKLPYSLIAFHGVANENRARETGMDEDDLKTVLEATWKGTKNLLTRSKKGHKPRLLLDIEYEANTAHLGELDKKIDLITEKEDDEIRGPGDYMLDISELVRELDEYGEKIEQLRLKIDRDFNKVIYDGEKVNMKEVLKNNFSEFLTVGL